MTWVLGFDEPAATQLELSGGKGANLARLTQWRHPVPPGFVVTADGYRAWADAGATVLGAVADLPVDDAAALRTAAERLRAGLAAVPLPPAVEAAVRTHLAAHPADAAFSVRSSSTMEDLAGAAFAGQHDTFLNCRGADAILARIRDCYGSLWHDRAIAYRRRQGFPDARAVMAVVVQRMVECEVAGVAFGINPVSGDLTEVVVDAAWGLGESVVSGEGEVDHVALDKATGAVRSQVIATKTHRIVSAPEGGTRTEPIGADQAAAPCLSPAQLADLVDLVRRVEADYAFPQDIEWGFAGGRCHLLQARPVTTIPPRWTRDESAERFPNVLTPLTWDLVEDGFHRSLTHSFRLLGFPPFEGRWFAMHDHYIYGNQNAVELYARQNPFRVDSLEALRALVPQLRERYRWVQELPVRWMRDLDHYLIGLGELQSEPLEPLDLAGLWAHIDRVREHGAEYFLPNIAISIAHGSLCRLLLGLLAQACGPELGRHLGQDLLAYCDTKTGAINREIWDLADLARRDPALGALLCDTPARTVIAEDRLAAFPAFAARFARFCRDHGHRELDFDAYHPTWAEAPWTVLENVTLLLRRPDPEPPWQRERELKVRQQQAELALLQRIPADLQFFFGEIVRLARVYTSLDDLEHYQTTRLTLPLRRALRALGDRLAARGVCAAPMDVFFARAADLAAAIAEDQPARWQALAASIAAAKAAYLAARDRSPDWVLGDAAPPPADGTEMPGLAGSPGVAVGRVCRVLDPDDFGRFPAGSVLVARTTNPTWTPLFYNAVAVITESGGPLSHGAVTAREMQIPAVMAVRGCLSLLADGDRVRVDGTRGVVSRVPDEA